MIFEHAARSEAAIAIEPRRFLIDALNVAYWCGNPPSLRVPLTLMQQLVVDGQAALLYFDASARYRLKAEGDLYAALVRHSAHFIEVASGRSADEVLLKHARASGACLISRDKYADHRKRYRKLIDDPTRLMTGWVKDGRVQLPSLAIDAPLAASAQAAWLPLQALLISEP